MLEGLVALFVFRDDFRLPAANFCFLISSLWILDEGDLPRAVTALQLFNRDWNLRAQYSDCKDSSEQCQFL